MAGAAQDAHVDRWVVGTEDGGHFYRWWLNYLGFRWEGGMDEARAQALLDAHWRAKGMEVWVDRATITGVRTCVKCGHPFEIRCKPCHRRTVQKYRARQVRAEERAERDGGKRFSAAGHR